MNNDFEKYLLPDQDENLAGLIDCIKQVNALVFVGSGLSVDAGYPDWSGLVKELMDSSGTQNANIEGKNYLDAIQVCKDAFAGEEYYSELRKIFNPHEPYRKEFSDSLIKLLKMPFLSYPTTNVDNCHVNAMVNLHSDIDKRIELPPHFSIDKVRMGCVYHLHGKVSDDDSIKTVVLSRDEYEKAYHNSESTNYGPKHFLLYVLTKFNCVFIGYSMTDPFMSEVFNEAKEIYKSLIARYGESSRVYAVPKHYALLPYKEIKRSLLVEAEKVNMEIIIERNKKERISKEREMKEFNITPIFYKVIDSYTGGINYNALHGFIKELANKVVFDNELLPKE